MDYGELNAREPVARHLRARGWARQVRVDLRLERSRGASGAGAGDAEGRRCLCSADTVLSAAARLYMLEDSAPVGWFWARWAARDRRDAG